MFLLALIAALYFARDIFLPIAFSITFALVLRPIVGALHRCHIPESLGAGIAVLAVLALLATVTMNVYEPAKEWARRAPETLRNAEYRLRALQNQVKEVERAAARGRARLFNQEIGEVGAKVKDPRDGDEVFVSADGEMEKAEDANEILELPAETGRGQAGLGGSIGHRRVDPVAVE